MTNSSSAQSTRSALMTHSASEAVPAELTSTPSIEAKIASAVGLRRRFLAHTNSSRLNLPQRHRLDRHRTRVALPTLASMRPIAERPLRRQPASAQRDRRLARQVPLLPIHIDQLDRPFHPKRPIRPHRNLHRWNHRLSRYCQFFRHVLSLARNCPLSPQHSKPGASHFVS